MSGIPISLLPANPSPAAADLVIADHAGITSQCSISSYNSVFADITTAQTIGGAKTFSSLLTLGASATYAVQQLRFGSGDGGSGTAFTNIGSSSTQTVNGITGNAVLISSGLGVYHLAMDVSGDLGVAGSLNGTSLVLPVNGAITNNLAASNQIVFGTTSQGTFFHMYMASGGTLAEFSAGASGVASGVTGSLFNWAIDGVGTYGAMDTSGNFGVTGAINFASSVTGQILYASHATTASLYQRFVNTGGAFDFGLESSAGGSVFTGGSAYASVFGSTGATSVQLATNNTVRLTISSAGAATFTSSVSAISLGSGNGTTAGTANFYSGTGAPSFSAPNGSMYLRYDGTTGSRWYGNTSGASSSGTTWTALAAP